MRDAFCVQWKTRMMPAWAFWYYANQADATAAYRALTRTDRTTAMRPRECVVPDNAPILPPPRD